MTDRGPVVRGTQTGRFWLALGGVGLGALAIRLWVVLAQRLTCSPPTGPGDCFRVAGDALYYHVQSQLIGDGHLFQHPQQWLLTGDLVDSATHPPAYSAFLGVFSAVGLSSATTHRVLSSIVGVAAVVVIALLARRLAGDRAGLIAGALAAVYPMLWINDGMLQAESLYALVIAVVLFAAFELRNHPTVRRAAVLGALVGVATLTRTEAALFFVVLVAPLLLLAPGLELRRRLQLTGVALGVGAALLVPWIVFNLLRFERPVLLSSGSGSVLTDASCDETYYGRYIGWHANCIVDPPLELTREDESVREAELSEEATEYIGDHLDRLPLVMAARVGRSWDVFKPGQNTELNWYLEGRGKRASELGLWAYYALIPPAVIGAVGLRRRGVTLVPVLSTAVVVTVAAALTFGVTRYRVPADVALVMLAGVGIHDTLNWLTQRRAQASQPPGGSS